MDCEKGETRLEAGAKVLFCGNSALTKGLLGFIWRGRCGAVAQHPEQAGLRPGSKVSIMIAIELITPIH